jgi:hypothetical protein
MRTLLAALALLAPATAIAQQFLGSRGAPSPLGLPRSGGVVDRGFTFCRLMYSRVRSEEGGGGWQTDYPNADANFMTRLAELTTVMISQRADGTPGYAVVTAMDDDLFECPFLFASDVGTVGFSDEEVDRLREYLLKGGFLWVDDFWGNRAWAQWESQVQRILPEVAIEEVPLDHPMLHAAYTVRRIPQIANIGFWRRNGGQTSERGAESAVPYLRAMFDENRSPMVLMSFNTDIADGWEREGQDVVFFQRFSPEAYGLGINVAVWVMTR